MLRISSIQTRASLGLRLGRSSTKRPLSIDKAGGAKADLRAARAKRMELAADGAKKRSQVANAKKEEPMFSGGTEDDTGNIDNRLGAHLLGCRGH